MTQLKHLWMVRMRDEQVSQVALIYSLFRVYKPDIHVHGCERDPA